MRRSAGKWGRILALILVVFLMAAPVTASAESLYQITGTRPEGQVQQKHGFDLGKPSEVQTVHPRSTARYVYSQDNRGKRRSGKRYRKTPRRRTVKRAAGKKASAAVTPKGRVPEGGKDMLATLHTSQPPKRVLVSKINETTVASKDPLQSNKGRKIASGVMMGIAGFSLVCALLYVLTAHRKS